MDHGASIPVDNQAVVVCIYAAANDFLADANHAVSKTYSQFPMSGCFGRWLGAAPCIFGVLVYINMELKPVKGMFFSWRRDVKARRAVRACVRTRSSFCWVTLSVPGCVGACRIL